MVYRSVSRLAFQEGDNVLVENSGDILCRIHNMREEFQRRRRGCRGSADATRTVRQACILFSYDLLGPHLVSRRSAGVGVRTVNRKNGSSGIVHSTLNAPYCFLWVFLENHISAPKKRVVKAFLCIACLRRRRLILRAVYESCLRCPVMTRALLQASLTWCQNYRPRSK